MYIHERENWTDFSWDNEKILPALASVRHLQGKLLGQMYKYIIKSFFFNIIFLSCFMCATAQNKADDVIGYYLTVDPFTEAISQVQIYKTSNDTYEGLISWAKDAEYKQYEGQVFLKNLSFNAKENEWEHGIINYPGRSGTYKAYMKFDSDGRLRVRGYWGISLLGKTVYWTRVDN